jgi:hypothetical protein
MLNRKTLLAAVLSMALPLSGNAAEAVLNTPVVSLMPHVKQLRASLGLTDQQASKIDNWIAEAPAKRKQLEGKMRQLREQMREAILNNQSRLVREDVKSQIAETEMRLIEMRALCVRMLRNTLNDKQFAKVVASFRAEAAG